MSPPMAGGTSSMSTMMNIPPPPPRYPGALPGATTGGIMIPPPPGPPPGSALAQNQAAWQSKYGRMYDGRAGMTIPPPPMTGQHLPYNPQLHAQMAAAGQTMAAMAPPRRPSETMSATYIPTGETYGEGVGIPGFGVSESALSASSQNSWHISTPVSGTDTNTTTPMEDPSSARDRLYSSSNTTSKVTSSPSAAAGTGSTIPPELAAQWPIDTVLIWLAKHQFSTDWQETFKALNLCGAQFLDLGSLHGGRGNFGMMHQKVYPRLAQECTNSGTGWDQSRERDEGKRMRRLIRSIVTGKPVDPAKMVSAHNRTNSAAGSQGHTSADAGDSPNVGFNSAVKFLNWLT